MNVTKRQAKIDSVVSALSWIIVIALLFGATYLWFVPAAPGGPVGAVIGALGAKIVYSVMYGVEGILLAYAKLRKKRVLRKNTLLAVYLTGIFTTILSVALGGVTLRIVDNVIFAVLSGAFWLYWKMRDDYLTREEICRSEQR